MKIFVQMLTVSLKMKNELFLTPNFTHMKESV